MSSRPRALSLRRALSPLLVAGVLGATLTGLAAPAQAAPSVVTISGDFTLGGKVTVSPVADGARAISALFYFESLASCEQFRGEFAFVEPPANEPVLTLEVPRLGPTGDGTSRWVRYLYNKDAGPEPSTCHAVGAPTYPTGPTAEILGDAKPGKTLVADTGAPSPSPERTLYSWTVDGSEVSTSRSYTVKTADVDKEVQVEVTISHHDFAAASSTDAVTAEAAVTSTYQGTPKVGETLTADEPEDVPEGAAVAYEWFTGTGEDRTSIQKGSELVLEREHAGEVLTLDTSVTEGGVTTTATSESATVAALSFDTAGTTVTGASGADGTPVTGDELVAKPATDLPSGTTTTYAWGTTKGVEIQRRSISNEPGSGGPGSGGPGSGGPTPQTCVTGEPSEDPTYEVSNGDAGSDLCVRVSYEAEGYDDASVVVPVGVAQGVFDDATASIDGTPRVGEVSGYTLTGLAPGADTTAVEWKVGDAVVSTESGYRPTPDDVGQDLTVTVTSSRKHFPDEVSTSEPVEVAKGSFKAARATIDGTPKVGATLTRSLDRDEQPEQPKGTTYTYRWGVQLPDETDCLAIGSSATTLTLSRESEGSSVCVITTASAPGYEDAVSVSELAGPIVGGDLTVWRPTISDTTPVVGQELSASVTREGYPSDADVRFTWGHQAEDVCTPIGRTSRLAGDGATYTVTPDDVDARLCVTVRVSAQGFEPDSASSRPTSAVEKGMLPASELSVGDTAPVFGETVTASVEHDAELPAGASVSYQWGTVQGQVEYRGPQVCAPIEGADDATFTIDDADLVGSTLCVSATVAADGYETQDLGPVTVGEVEPKDNPVTGASLSDSTPTFGDALSVSLDGQPAEDSTVTYRWGSLYDDGEDQYCKGFTAEEDLAGYTVSAADVGEVLCVRVRVVAPGHRVLSTVVVADAPTAPAEFTAGSLGLDRAPIVDRSSTASLTGLEPGTKDVSYRWTVDGTEVATSATYTPTLAQVGRTIAVTVVARRTGYADFERTVSGTVGVPGRGLAVPSTVRVGETFTVTGTGLKPNQTARVWLGGKLAWSGRADAAGRVIAKVTFPASVRTGQRLVRVSGYELVKNKEKRTYTESRKVTLTQVSRR